MIVTHEEAQQLVSQSQLVVHVKNGYCLIPQQASFHIAKEYVCQLTAFATGRVLFIKQNNQLIATFFLFNY